MVANYLESMGNTTRNKELATILASAIPAFLSKCMMAITSNKKNRKQILPTPQKTKKLICIPSWL
jgi:hypothetical protein